MATEHTPSFFDLVAHLKRQSAFSFRTFGPGERVAGVCDHIRKELVEIEEAAASCTATLPEWVDVIILAFDGAWRSGATAEQIVDAIVAKQTKNEGRTWPDWRTADPNKAIEHDRSGEAQPVAMVTKTDHGPGSVRLEWASVQAAHNAKPGPLFAAAEPAVAAAAGQDADPVNWHAHGMDWAFVESTDPAGSDDWTTDDVARAFAAGAGLAERFEREKAMALRGQLDVLRGWIREALGPLEVSEALVDDEDGGEAMRKLLEAGRLLVNGQVHLEPTR